MKLIYNRFKPEITTATKGFGYGILFGIIVGYFIIKNQEQFLNFLKPIYEDIAKDIDPLNPSFYPAFKGILQRNVQVSLIAIGAGFFHKFFPKAIIFFNGLLIGIVIYALSLIGRVFETLLLIPHGIFEIPAIILATAFGISLSTKAEGNWIQRRVRSFQKSWSLIFYILGLLIIAATIESLGIVVLH